MRRLRLAVGLLGSLLGLLVAPAKAYEYQKVLPLLPPSGFTSSGVGGINQHGVIVGSLGRSGPTPAISPFIYQNGVMKAIETPGWQFAQFTGLNDVGDMVGVARATESSPFHAIHYNNGVLTDLGTLGGVSSRAVAVNNLGQIAGYYQTALGQSRPFLYSDGQMIELPITYPDNIPDAVPLAINDNGQIMGSYGGGPYPRGNGWYYLNGQTIQITAGGASGMNANGDIVGQMQVPVGYDENYNLNYDARPYLLSGGRLTNLGLPDPYLGSSALNAWAEAINNRGQIVGEYTDFYDERYSTTPCRYVCVFLKDGDVMQNIELFAEPTELSIQIYSVSGINDAGQIIGNASIYGSGPGIGVGYVFNPVPLPAGVWLLLSGMAVLGLRARRTRRTRCGVGGA